jgi:FixJ family two-component response regulator
VTGSDERGTRRGGASTTGVDIAVVDDDPSVRRSLERLLRSTGLRVVTFESAEQFLTLCRPDEVSCLILDVHLGGMSGIELHTTLRKAGILTPVILISGHDDPSTNDAMRSSGALHLQKPFDEQVLLAAITQSLASQVRPHPGAPTRPG